MERYRFFDSIDGEDERYYTADEFAEYFRQLITSGIFNGDTNLQVLGSGTDMSITIQPGYAWLEGYLYKIDTEPLGLILDAADPALDRIDRIVIRLDKSLENRYVKAFILKGEPAEEPIAPELTRDENIYEIALAQIRVIAGKSFIAETEITDERFDGEVCGIVNSLIQADVSHIVERLEGEWQTWFDGVQGATYLTPKSLLEGYSGKYKGFYGLSNCIFDGCAPTPDGVSMSQNKIVTRISSAATSNNLDVAVYMIGQRLSSEFTKDISYIEKVAFYLSSYSPSGPAIYLSVYDVTDSVELKSVPITSGDLSVGYITFSIDTIIIPGHVIDLRLRQSGAAATYDVRFRKFVSGKNGYTDSYFIDTTAQWAYTEEHYTDSLFFILYYTVTPKASRAYRRIAPYGLSKWGNLDWFETIPESTSINCDILRHQLNNLSVPVLDEPSIHATVYALYDKAIKFTLDSVPVGGILKVKLLLTYYGGDSLPLEVKLFNAVEGAPGGSLNVPSVTLGKRDMRYGNVTPTIDDVVEITFDVSKEILVTGSEYFVVLIGPGSSLTFSVRVGSVSDSINSNVYSGNSNATMTKTSFRAYIEVTGLDYDSNKIATDVLKGDNLSIDANVHKDIWLVFKLSRINYANDSPILKDFLLTFEGLSSHEQNSDYGEYDENLTIQAKDYYTKRIPLSIPASKGTLLIYSSTVALKVDIDFRTDIIRGQTAASIIYSSSGSISTGISTVYLMKAYIDKETNEIVFTVRNASTSASAVFAATISWEVYA